MAKELGHKEQCGGLPCKLFDDPGNQRTQSTEYTKTVLYVNAKDGFVKSFSWPLPDFVINTCLPSLLPMPCLNNHADLIPDKELYR